MRRALLLAVAVLGLAPAGARRPSLATGVRATLRLKLSRAIRRTIKRSLARRGRRALVRITVRAADPAGNATTKVRRVRIVR